MLWKVYQLKRRTQPDPRPTLTEHERRGLLAGEVGTIKQLIQPWVGQTFTQARADKLNRHLKAIRRLLSDGRPRSPRLPAQERAARQSLRLEVFQAYGGRCVCCGESDPRALTIDHVKPLKGRQRKDVYRQIVRAGYPPDKFQVLCLNCNQLKGTSDHCPHQRKGEPCGEENQAA